MGIIPNLKINYKRKSPGIQNRYPASEGDCTRNTRKGHAASVALLCRERLRRGYATSVALLRRERLRNHIAALLAMTKEAAASRAAGIGYLMKELHQASV